LTGSAHSSYERGQRDTAPYGSCATRFRTEMTRPLPLVWSKLDMPESRSTGHVGRASVTTGVAAGLSFADRRHWVDTKKTQMGRSPRRNQRQAPHDPPVPRSP